MVTLFWISIFITILAGIAMQWSEKQIPVSNGAFRKNFGIKLQFAKSRQLLSEMIRSIGPSGKAALGFNLGMDYAYIIGFYGFLAIFALLLSVNHPVICIARSGMLFSYAMIVPYCADCFENFCLAKWSFNENWKGPFKIYYWAVRIKWAIAVIVGLYCVTMVFYNPSLLHQLFAY